MGEASARARAAPYVYHQRARFGQGHAEVVLVEHRVDAPPAGVRQGDGGGLTLGVAVVVRSRRKGSLKRVAARGRAAKAAHFHQVGAAAQSFFYKEVASSAAVVVVEQFVVAVGLAEQSTAGVCVAGCLQAQCAQRRQVDAEDVRIQCRLQCAGGCRWQGCRRRRGPCVAMVVVSAVRPEPDVQRIEPRRGIRVADHRRPRGKAAHGHDVCTGRQRGLDAEVLIDAAVVVLQHRPAVRPGEGAVGVDVAAALHAQSGGLRQVDAEVVDIVRPQHAFGGRGYRHRRSLLRGISVIVVAHPVQSHLQAVWALRAGGATHGGEVGAGLHLSFEQKVAALAAVVVVDSLEIAIPFSAGQLAAGICAAGGLDPQRAGARHVDAEVVHVFRRQQSLR